MKVSPFILNQSYGTWFGSHIKTILADDPASKAVLFVTLTFKKHHQNRDLSAEGQPLGERELDTFSLVYNRVCRDVVGRNYHRASHRPNLPDAIALIDAEGSKYWASILEPRNLHIHSIWVIAAEKLNQVKTALADAVSRIDHPLRVDGIDIKQIDVTDIVSIDKVASYSSKLLGFNAAKLTIGEDFRIYPM